MSEPYDQAVTVVVGDAPAVAVPVAGGTSGVLVGRQCVLIGWSLLETTGAAAANVDLYDGLGVGGVTLARLAIPQGASSAVGIGDAGVLCRRGLYVDAAAGSAAGAVWVKLLD